MLVAQNEAQKYVWDEASLLSSNSHSFAFHRPAFKTLSFAGSPVPRHRIPASSKSACSAIIVSDVRR